MRTSTYQALEGAAITGLGGSDMVDAENTSIEALDLSVRSLNGLQRGGIRTVAQLLLTSDDALLSIRNFGYKCLVEVKSQLVERGYLEPSVLRVISEAPESDVPFLSWGEATSLILPHAMEEAQRSGHSAVAPVHFLLAVLQQAVTVQWLRSMGQQLEMDKVRSAMNRHLPYASPPSGEMQLTSDSRLLLSRLRTPRPGEDESLMFLLVLKALLRECKVCVDVLMLSGLDPEVMASNLDKVE